MSNVQNQLTILLTLRDATADPVQRAALDAAIAALQGSMQTPVVDLRAAQMGDSTIGDVAGRDMHKGTEGSVELSADARINGVAVGVNLGTIIYRRDPKEDERSQLVRYLARLAAKLRRLPRLPLSGLAARLDDGEGVAMERVYIQLATNNITEYTRGYLAELTNYLEPDPERDIRSWIKASHHPDLGLPTNTISMVQLLEAPDDPHYETVYILWRALLVTEAVHDRRQFVLLGDPGSGKSTFLRHLAWALAQRGLDQLGDHTPLLGWADDARLLPILLPLRRLAGQIAGDGAAPTVVSTTLVGEMEREYGARDAADLLDRALTTGSALLLLDGLDEVPVNATSNSASRLATLRAVRDFADLYPDVRIVITCRTRALSDELRACLGWAIETIAPFTLGQIRHFVVSWFTTLYTHGSLDQEKATHYAQTLVDAIIGNKRLCHMAETPLLLTIMALVLVERGELPRDRPQLYERILDLLLGQWDKVREGASLAEAISLPDWDSPRFQPLLDQFSYQAHRAGSSIDGRGRLARGDLYKALIDFFKAAQVAAPGDAALRWLDYVEQRSGLLTPDGPDSYVFAHLTLQEHCAGRHIALNSENPVTLVMEHRADDRWREPIFLGAGLMHPAVLNSLLSDLVEPEGKDSARWYRDLILAAELGKDRDWSYLRTRPMVKVERLQRDLKKGLVALLADKAQPLPVAERVRAGFLLGELGDPRYPVTVEEWRTELAQAGQPGSYFCWVDAGTYIIGSSDNDPDADDSEKPQHTTNLDQPLLIARYPITNDQWQAWVAQGGEKSSYDYNTDLNYPNQPVVGISWEMANNYCSWLSEQLGTTVRLPSEAEWEAAARGGDARRYPWGDDWRVDHAASAENKETRGWERSVPVGCFPAGSAHCGALDIVGNVYEWMGDIWRTYPGAKKAHTEEQYWVVRGGCYGDSHAKIRCTARVKFDLYLGYDFAIDGFRVVTPQPTWMS